MQDQEFCLAVRIATAWYKSRGRIVCVSHQLEYRYAQCSDIWLQTDHVCSLLASYLVGVAYGHFHIISGFCLVFVDSIFLFALLRSVKAWALHLIGYCTFVGKTLMLGSDQH